MWTPSLKWNKSLAFQTVIAKRGRMDGRMDARYIRIKDLDILVAIVLTLSDS